MDPRKSLQETLQSQVFLMLNMKLLQYLGKNSALILAFLINKDLYFSENGMLTEDGYFYMTVNYMRDQVILEKDSQLRTIFKLKEKGFIDTDMRGSPPKRYFKINHTVIDEYLQQDLEGTDKYLDSLKCRKNRNLKDANCENRDISKESISAKSDFQMSQKATLIKTNINKTKKESVYSYLASQDSLEQPTSRVAPIGRKPKINKETKPTRATPIFKLRDKMPCPRVTKEIQEILDHWNSLGLKRKIPKPTTSSYAELVGFIKDLLDGTLFSAFKYNKEAIRKYSVGEVKSSLNNFALAVNNKDYFPMNKYFLETMSPSRFFYIKTEVYEDRKSYFLKYLMPPKKIAGSYMTAKKDNFPYVTNRLETWFKSTFSVVGIDGNFKKNDLVNCSIRLNNFYETNKDKLSNIQEHYGAVGVYEPINFLAKHLTMMFDKKLRNNPNNYSKITTSWLKNDITFDDDFPNYLKSERLMK